MKVRILLIFLAFSILPGCSTNKQTVKEAETAATEQELKQKQQELEKKNVEILDLKSAIEIQQAELSEMQEERERLQSIIDQLETEKAKADSANQILLDSLNQQKENLESLLKAFEEERQLSKQIVENIKSTADTVFVPETTVVVVQEEKPDSLSPQMELITQTPPISDQEYRERYNQAMELYWQKQFPRAIQEFHNLIELWPKHHLADNAQYWAGECFYSLGKYYLAIQEFEKVFTFEESNKYDAALLKIGLSYLKLGEKEKARKSFSELERSYPDSKLVEKARQYLKSEF